MPVSPYLKACQLIAASIAIVANIFLLYLILFQAKKSFGRYRILMISFSIYSIIYAFVEICTLPVLHIYKSGVILFPHSFVQFNYAAAYFMATLFCGSFAISIGLLCKHFVFRYFAMCQTSRMYLFEGKRIFLFYIPPFILFLIWSTIMAYNFGPSPEKSKFWAENMIESFEVDVFEIAYLSPIYFVRDSKGQAILSWMTILGAIICFSIMMLYLFTCLWCAFKTYQKLNGVSIEMSERTRALNKQLFWTLGLQTLFPCATQFIPVGLAFTVPLFEVEVGKMGNVVTALCCWYPAMDPLIAMVMIDIFRNFILRKNRKTSSINSG